jgi:hypothetical protein
MEFTDSHAKSLSSVIPNSAIVISYKPLENPKNWRVCTYVFPDWARMRFTGIFLAVAFTLIAAAVGGLHFRERKQEKKANERGTIRFHFDPT